MCARTQIWLLLTDSPRCRSSLTQIPTTLSLAVIHPRIYHLCCSAVAWFHSLQVWGVHVFVRNTDYKHTNIRKQHFSVGVTWQEEATGEFKEISKCISHTHTKMGCVCIFGAELKFLGTWILITSKYNLVFVSIWIIMIIFYTGRHGTNISSTAPKCTHISHNMEDENCLTFLRNENPDLLYTLATESLK